MNDAHLHLQDKRFDNIELIISEMRSSGIDHCVVNGTNPEDWEKVQQLAEDYPDFILPSYGLHPWHTPIEDSDWKQKLTAYIHQSELKCIGECGLDRWMKSPNKEAQEDAFLYQLAQARNYNSPVSIHILKAWGWFLDLLRAHHFPTRGFLLHSYNGSAELLHELIDNGAYFSFSGYFLHEKKDKQLDIFKQIPLDRLLIESDAPDMLPPEFAVSHRVGNTTNLNHPANVRSIAKHLAKSLGIASCDLEKQLDDNFNRFFLQ